MKKLTYSAMAVARLRANKRQYLSLVIGIFLAVFLITVFFLAVQGFLLAQIEKTENTIGKLDAFLLDNPEIRDEHLETADLILEMGHVYVTAAVSDTDNYIGYYDATAAEHLNRELLEGRMPQSSGEIVVEQGTLISMDFDKDWSVGDTLELSLVPIDGTEETRRFTLVGILNDQTAKLDLSVTIHSSKEYVSRFPAMLISADEESFETGRIAVHRTFITRGGKLGLKRIEEFQKTFGKYASYAQFLIISATGTVEYDDPPMYNFTGNGIVVLTLVMGSLLILSLMVSCGIGIAGTMEGALSRRSEEIGLLRAVGATKRQIRRIFGRENLILALLIAPLSIVLGVVAVGIIAWFVPEQMVLRLNPFLLIPVLLLSILFILLAGSAPLRRCSILMPMSIIRDTAVLRKHKRIRSRKNFRVSGLISGRLLRLYPSRQIGSGFLAALMLLCLFCAAICVNVGVEKVTADTPAFELTAQGQSRTGFVGLLPDSPLSSQSIAHICRLPLVSDVVIERNIDLLVLLDEPGYMKYENPALYTEEEYIAELENQTDTMLNSDYYAYSIQNWKTQVSAYKEVQDRLQVEQDFVCLNLNTVVLNESTLRDKYSHWIASGEIDLDAINAGKEVLVAAPKIWSGTSSQGYAYTHRGPEPSSETDILIAENDCFYPGQVLPMIQLYLESDDYEKAHNFIDVQRRDATVTVGAVLDHFDGSWFSRATIVTTEEGLQNMGLYANGYDTYRIYLDGDIDQQTEGMLVQRIESISSAHGNFHFRNALESYRENLSTKIQLVTVFSAISILFAAVSVSMIVSSITRRIQSDGRRIGMLRAVGADKRTILGCYSGQINVSLLGGFSLTSVIIVLILASGMIEGLELYAVYGFAGMVTLTVLSWGICRWILRRRIRAIVNKSIIDNIREL